MLTYTPEAALGTPCPDFHLPSVEGKNYGLKSFSNSKVLAVVFMCNHCPYVMAIEDRLLALAKNYRPETVQFVGICSNDPTDHPEDRPENLKQRWQEKAYGFPYLIDADQSVARAFGAVCTPDFFVFGPDRRLAYRGRLDDSWRNSGQVRRQELKEALDALSGGQSIAGTTQTPSMGCSIKWKPPGIG